MLLFFKLAKIRREKGGAKAVFANREYLINAMNKNVPEKNRWGRDRFLAAKKVLRDEGMVEDIQIRQSKTGKIGYRLALNLYNPKSASVQAVSGEGVHGGEIQKNTDSPQQEATEEGNAVYALPVYGEGVHGLNKEEVITKDYSFSRERAAGDPQEKKSESIEDLSSVFSDENPVPAVSKDESPDYLHSVEEFRKFVNAGKHQDKCPYKVGDEEHLMRQLTACFNHAEDKGRKIRKDRADYTFDCWLFPKWETEEQKKQLRSAWAKHQKMSSSRRGVPNPSNAGDGLTDGEKESKKLAELVKAFAQDNPAIYDKCDAKAKEIVEAKYPNYSEIGKAQMVRGERYKLLQEAFVNDQTVFA